MLCFKMKLKETAREDAEWIHLAHDGCSGVLLLTVFNLRIA
jgi:hypothetical protein